MDKAIKAGYPNVIETIGEGMIKKGLVRVYWAYDKSTDIYGECETFYGYERMPSTFKKLMKLPSDAEVDELHIYDDLYEVMLR